MGLRDEAAALDALALIDIGDAAEVARALRATLRIRQQHRRLFDDLFDRLWKRATHDRATRDREGMPPPPAQPPAFEIRRAAIAPEKAAEQGGRRETAGGYSAEAKLRRKRFDECTDEDLRRMQGVLERLARRLATRRSRRLVPDPRGRVVDVRRSLRRSLPEAELLQLARRRRRRERPRLVLLCDTSGSMQAYTRMLLAFALALERVVPGTETFAFNTSLTRLTGWIRPANLLATLERLARGIDDWAGGTRIGASLAQFADRWLAATVTGDTTVLILSDGLDRGDLDLLDDAMARIRRRTRRIIWLNPLAGDDRYRPEARGMRTALPYVDHLLPAHDLAALEELVPLLA